MKKLVMMKKLVLNGLCVGLFALLLPVACGAQTKAAEYRPVRMQAQKNTGSEISGQATAQLRVFARSLPDESLSPEGVKTAVANGSNSGVIDLGALSIEDAAILVMKLAAAETEADIRQQLEAMEAMRKRNAAVRAGAASVKAGNNITTNEAIEQSNRTTGTRMLAQDQPGQDKDSLPDAAEAISRRLAEQQRRREKIFETMRKMMEAQSSTEAGIIGNIK